MKLSLLSSALALAVSAQTLTAYQEPHSGISVQAIVDADSGYSFGLALPQNGTGDFIGILTGKGTGWSGVSLGGSMVGELLIAAWPNGTSILGSFRKASGYSSPPVAAGKYSLHPILNGTYINSTNWVYTFLCKACILSDGTTFGLNDTTALLGWAVSTNPPATPTSNATALNRHSEQGNWEANLTAAKSASFGTWASWAK